MEKLNVITDAELINQYSAEAMREPAPVIETQAPSSSEVKLLAGLIRGQQVLLDAEVRELNGADEEAIMKSGGMGKSLMTILRRGVVSIGGEPVTDDMLDSLLAGDRDHLMLAICRITFGSSSSVRTTCPSCGVVGSSTIDLDKDVPVTPFNGDWSWTIPTKLGELGVGFYNGITQKKLMENLDKNSAEISTLILAGCIRSLDGRPVIAVDVARAMGMADRETVLQEVLEKAPGPRLLEVTTACEACGEKIFYPLSLASLFRL